MVKVDTYFQACYTPAKKVGGNIMPTYLPVQWENHKVYLEPTDWRRICKCFRRIPYYVGDKIKVRLVVKGENARSIIEQIPFFEHMPRFGVEEHYYRYIDLKHTKIIGNNKKAYLELETCVIERPGDIRYGVAQSNVLYAYLPLPTMIQNILLLTAETSEQRWYKQVNYILILLSATIGGTASYILLKIFG